MFSHNNLVQILIGHSRRKGFLHKFKVVSLQFCQVVPLVNCKKILDITSVRVIPRQAIQNRLRSNHEKNYTGNSIVK